jgi:hypothetical protein
MSAVRGDPASATKTHPTLDFDFLEEIVEKSLYQR